MIPTISIVGRGTFQFIRSNDPVFFGKGDWVVYRGNSTNNPRGLILSEMDQNELTALARERGMSEEYNFSRVIPKPAKTSSGRRTRIPGVSGRRGSMGTLTGFNPLL